jgi:hypothetical protein
MIWSELIADILLIDKIQTYGSCKYGDIIACILNRCILMVFGVYFIYFIGCTLESKYYGLFAFTTIIIAETLYICIQKRGVDFKWFNWFL